MDGDGDDEADESDVSDESDEADVPDESDVMDDLMDMEADPFQDVEALAPSQNVMTSWNEVIDLEPYDPSKAVKANAQSQIAMASDKVVEPYDPRYKGNLTKALELILNKLHHQNIYVTI